MKQEEKQYYTKEHDNDAMIDTMTRRESSDRVLSTLSLRYLRLDIGTKVKA